MRRVPEDLWSFTSRRFFKGQHRLTTGRSETCVYRPTGSQPDKHIFPKRTLYQDFSDLLVRGLGVHHPTNFNGLLMRSRNPSPAADETAVKPDVKTRVWSWPTRAGMTGCSSPNS
ncbi:hypothetical protein N7537_001969 [Penicillium hordei]|uniref:Uncharacterized protein n=1 Tax=Penicillium hordei TaxID=40994 RepID=A0AAD6EHR3_9EURO|nr:uncharacterized protein N7537_001969 [Penicillium hordei]KAJ5616855.1 hypothetical protein N7537_001969 [Penicillium hordei]